MTDKKLSPQQKAAITRKANAEAKAKANAETEAEAEVQADNASETNVEAIKVEEAKVETDKLITTDKEKPVAKPSEIDVVAVGSGFYGNEPKEVGDKFTIKSEKELGSWMKKA